MAPAFLRVLQLDAKRHQQSIMMNSVVALAGSALETFAIRNDEVAATVPDQSFRLEYLRQQRDRSPAHAQHLGESFLGQRQLVAAGAIGALQKAARELTIKSANLMQEDWSNWTMRVHDHEGTELFSLVMSDFRRGNHNP